MLRTKRVYEKREPGDGKRILVDRLWPRGLTRQKAAIDEWLKDLAPSDDLRQWFGHEPERWPEFQRRYTEELLSPDRAKLLDKVVCMAREGNVTIVYAARDIEHNNAKVLEEVLESVAAVR
ncbi:MAG: DUF488 family protein [Dehalococcoidia bacterium]|nr:DUF488 family protein [Dehalococcoidia bacterium]